jgi:outer membrane protein assembly factor BamB
VGLRRAGLAAAMVGALALLVPVPAFGAAVAYQADAAHSGFVANGPNPPLGRKWIRRDLGVRVSYPVIAEGKVFVTAYASSANNSSYGSSSPSDPTFLHALDRNTGATVWTRQVATGGLPAYGDGRVYVLGTEALDAVSAATGERVWRAEMRGGSEQAPVADGPFVYASDGRGAHAVSADTGLIVQSESDFSSSGFAVVGDRIYLTKEGCRTIALYTRGLAQQVWSRSGCSTSGRVPVPGAYHTLNSTPPNERLWARDSEGLGGLVVDALTSLGAEQFASAGGIALAGEHAYLRQSGVVEARSQASGVTAWRVSPASQMRGGALAVRDFVWVVGSDGALIALRRSDGANLFSSRLVPEQLERAQSDGSTFAHHGMAADENGLIAPYVNRLVALGTGAETPGVDDPDKIPAGTTRLSAQMRPRDFEFGTKVKLTGSVSDSSQSSSSSSDAVHSLELQADPYPYDGAWQVVDRAQVRSSYDYTLDHRADRNTRYRVVDTSTAPAVISKTYQAWVYARIRLGLGYRGTGRIRVSATVSGPDYLKLNGKRVYVYRLRSRRSGGVRIGSIKLKRAKGTTHKAAGTLRVPSHRPRTDYFLICIRYPDTRQLTRLNGRKDPCGGRRV